jgi:hypothetical protein
MDFRRELRARSALRAVVNSSLFHALLIFRFGSSTATRSQASAISDSRRIAELSWT